MDLAYTAGIEVGQLRMILNGERALTVDLFRKLAPALDLDVPAELMEG